LNVAVIDDRATEKTDDNKDESEDAGKDDSKEKTPLVEPEKVRYYCIGPTALLK